jgi:hypothetical protein
MIAMSRSTRLTLLILGLALVLFAFIAIAYALAPVELNRAVSTLSPTLFSAP